MMRIKVKILKQGDHVFMLLVVFEVSRGKSEPDVRKSASPHKLKISKPVMKA